MHVPVTVNGKNPYRGNLYVGDGDVEQIVHVGKPDHAHVRDDHGDRDGAWPLLVRM